MTKTNEDYINIREFYKLFRKKLKIFYITTASVVGLTIIYLNIAALEYTVEYKVIPVASSANKIGEKLGALAGLAGISAPQNSEDIYFDIYMLEDKRAFGDSISKRRKSFYEQT